MLLIAIAALALSVDEFKPSNSSVFFAKGAPSTADVIFDAAQEKTLERQLQWLHDNASAKFVLLPHTDDVECKEDCFALAERRAQAVQHWLLQHGVDASRLEVGEHARPLPDLDQNTSKKPAGDFARRVEFFGFAL